jgi:caffeoyl-CoA O-methyltransferase
MMSRDEAIEAYILQHMDEESDYLKALYRQTHVKLINPRMTSGHLQGRLLKMLVQMVRPHRILEIGTFAGYSALCMAAGLDDGATIDTCEVDDELQPLAQSFFDRSPHGHKIRQHIGSALDIAPQLGKQFDMVFIDGDKREYPAYYNMLMDNGLVHSGSILLADNILWYGKVVQPVAHNDRHTEALIEFNRMVREDDRVESVILPLRDGINIIRVK